MKYKIKNSLSIALAVSFVALSGVTASAVAQSDTPKPAGVSSSARAPLQSAKPVQDSSVWNGSIYFGSTSVDTSTPLAVTINAPSGNQTNKIVYVEAWQDNAKKADVFVEGRNLTGTTTHNLILPALPAGTYELRLMVFDGPPPGSYDWGTQRLYSVEGNIFISSKTTSPTPTPTPTPTPSRVLYDGPGQVDSYPGFDVLKNTPTARWYAGGTPAEVQADIRRRVTAANGQIVSLLVYNAPIRDNGSYSAGGAANLEAYKAYIDGLATGIGNAPVIVSVEPDALGHLGDLSASQQAERIECIKYAIQKLKENPNAKVYVDASNWVDATEMTNRVKRTIPAGVTIDGISVNVSAYNSNSSIIDYGNKVITASNLPWKMIVDTSRNGVATANTWCNPSGQGLGKKPTLDTGIANVDAFLWLKAPGESDGECNGGPHAGAFWPEKAQELINNARF